MPSAGHTDAKYSDMIEAKKYGCNLITHFYSCTSTITRELGVRKLGVLECGFLWDDMFIEIIADGKHLPLELIKLILKVKGTDNVMMCTDSLSVAGSDVKTNDTPQKLSPVLRKVMAKKEFVMQTVQDVLKNDCKPDEIKWNTNLLLEIGIRPDKRNEIYRSLGLDGWEKGTVQYSHPLAMFLQVINRDFPARYDHIDVYNLHNFEKALQALGDDAVALGIL